MSVYAHVYEGVVQEIILPMYYDVEAPDWVEGAPSRIGQEIPILLRYPAEWVSAMYDITNLDPQPTQGWTFDGINFAAPFTGVTLAEAAASKVAELRQKCDDEIERTSFTSSALGAVHNYDCRLVDQININLRHQVALHTGESEPLWASDGTRYTWKDHSASELIDVVVDMNEHIKENQVLLVSKLAAVDAATTIAQINAIVW